MKYYELKYLTKSGEEQYTILQAVNSKNAVDTALELNTDIAQVLSAHPFEIDI